MPIKCAYISKLQLVDIRVERICNLNSECFLFPMRVAVFGGGGAELFAEALAEVAGIAHSYHECDFRYGVSVVFEEDGGFAGAELADKACNGEACDGLYFAVEG